MLDNNKGDGWGERQRGEGMGGEGRGSGGEGERGKEKEEREGWEVRREGDGRRGRVEFMKRQYI